VQDSPSDNDKQKFNEGPEQACLIRDPYGPSKYGRPPIRPHLPNTNWEGENVGLLGYWQMLRRAKGTLFLFAVVGVLGGVLVSLPQIPVYEARASIEIQNLNENYLNLRGIEPIAINYAADSYIQTQIQILQSHTLVSRVVNAMKKKLPPNEQVVPLSRSRSWLLLVGVPAPAPTLVQDKELAEIAESLKVRGSGLTRMLQISCESENAQLAADFANTVTKEYVDQNLEARWNAAQSSGDWLVRQLSDLQIKLEKSEEQLQQYAALTGLLFTAGKESVSELKLRQVQEELSRAEADRVVKQARLEQINNNPPESLPEVLDDGSLRSFQMKLADLRREQAELSAIVTPEHPKLERVQAQVEELRETLVRERNNILRRMRNEYESAARREAMLKEAHREQTKTVGEHAEKAIHYKILQREVETTRQLYESMLQKTKEAGIASAMSVSNIRVVDAARPPSNPSRPNHRLSGFLGLFCGGLMGIVVVSMRARADRSLRDPGDAIAYVNVPELGVIPAAHADPSTAPLVKRQNRLSLLVRPDKAEDGTALETTDDRLELVLTQRPFSQMAEAYRATLTSLLFCEPTMQKRVIAISSPNEGEGKTTTLANLGLALAEIGQRVLLIDGDVRKPRLHKIFDLPTDLTLTDILKDKRLVLDAPVDDLVQPTKVADLFVLPSRTGSASVASLLYSPRLALALGRFRSEFDVILIDTPPTLQMCDARVVGRLTDAVVLVFRLGSTTKDSAAAAVRRLSEDGTCVLGTILNDWDPRRTAIYGYRYPYMYNRTA
jgi:succinoglycan biosynthesis transport protein ExoP